MKFIVNKPNQLQNTGPVTEYRSIPQIPLQLIIDTLMEGKMECD